MKYGDQKSISDTSSGLRWLSVISKKRKNRDTLAPDGVTDFGTRLVRKGGKVKFCKSEWQSDDLVGYVGSRVLVQAGDYYLTEITVFLGDSFQNSSIIIKSKTQIDKT